jgi:SAM-dependent methyltransferase
MGHCERNLYEDGRHYDLLMPGPNDLPFYQRQVTKYGGPVLELGCGTGRLTIPLNLAGADITGLDVAPAMLEVARSKAQRNGVTISFVQADVRQYSLGREFKLILFADNSLSHLLQREEIEACFHCVHQHLAPEGRFIVDLFTPSLRLLTRDSTQRYPVGQYEDPDGGGRITVTETSQYDPATQVNHIIWHYQQDNKPKTEVPLRLRMFYPQEIDALLSYNGFTIEHKYGDFEEAPYATNSQKQLIICS